MFPASIFYLIILPTFETAKRNHMKQLFLLLFGLALFVLPYCQAQPLTSEEHPVTLNTASGSINGKLLLPAHAKSCHVVVLIAGSGPTDMDGNNPMMKIIH